MLSRAHNRNNCIDSLAAPYGLREELIQGLRIHPRLLIDGNTYDISRPNANDGFQREVSSYTPGLEYMTHLRLSATNNAWFSGISIVVVV